MVKNIKLLFSLLDALKDLFQNYLLPQFKLKSFHEVEL